MKRFFIFFNILLVVCFNLHAQGEIDKQGKIFYRNEKSAAILINSNGFGLNGRYAKRVDAARKILYDLDIVYYRHPKEVRVNNPLFSSSNNINTNYSNFVLGKQYLPIILKFGFGKQQEIFRKFDVGGISVRKFYTLGPAIAVLKPIYYNIYNDYDTIVKVERFNRGSPVIYIAGRASILKGIDELKIIPGAFLKGGFCFEYSKKDQVLNALEIGGVLEGYVQELPIMGTKENYQILISLFISYRFGVIFDPNAPKSKRQKQDYSY